MYEERKYRSLTGRGDLVQFYILQEETDLLIAADADLSEKADEIVRQIRMDLTKYIAINPHFETSFIPVKKTSVQPRVIREMVRSTEKFGIGPMASVAGAVSDLVGKELLKYSKQVIVENGGDIFMKTDNDRTVAVLAGNSPFSGNIAIEIKGGNMPVGICTSSGTSGHSFSFGSADAVVVISDSASAADAAATYLGNMVKKVEDIDDTIRKAGKIKNIRGVMIIKDDRMGLSGDIKITKI